MYINITDSEKGNNKVSSGALVHYLDKENRLYKPEAPMLWFNGNNSHTQSYEVKNKLDNNIAKLGRGDAKFFLINISPSQKEISHLKELYGEDAAKEKLKEYAVRVMDEYAKNFKRADINSNTDLLWFGKLESHRYYSHKDKEVKNGLVKRGTAKPGEQMHIQVIVSRKDITNKIKLSPMNKSRGRNTEHSKKLGQFDRVAFKNSGEKLFDQQFGFDRPISETFKYANINAKGNLKEKLEIHAANIQVEPVRKEKSIEANSEPITYLKLPEPTDYLGLLLEKQNNEPLGTGLRKKRKRRKHKSQDNEQGLSM
ncbi:MAG: molybdopterin-guanine dinucleotide biosynthesis protein MobB [Flavobacterium sp.]|nr:MAG: molybdopterin-guanine dinucleotide biosynthesis protein MobB [Flavobacterium sp.]